MFYLRLVCLTVTVKPALFWLMYCPRFVFVAPVVSLLYYFFLLGFYFLWCYIPPDHFPRLGLPLMLGAFVLFPLVFLVTILALNSLPILELLYLKYFTVAVSDSKLICYLIFCIHGFLVLVTLMS